MISEGSRDTVDWSNAIFAYLPSHDEFQF